MFDGKNLPRPPYEWTLAEKLASDAQLAVMCAKNAARLRSQAATTTCPSDKRSLMLRAAAERRYVVRIAVRIEVSLQREALYQSL